MYASFIREILIEDDRSVRIIRDMEIKASHKEELSEIDYLNDHSFVAFVGIHGELCRKVILAKSSHILGYHDKELIGFDYTELVPMTLRDHHDKVDLFGRLLLKTEESWAITLTFSLFLSHKLERLVPVWLKVRLFLDP
jgi:hypothetical protein